MGKKWDRKRNRVGDETVFTPFFTPWGKMEMGWRRSKSTKTKPKIAKSMKVYTEIESTKRDGTSYVVMVVIGEEGRAYESTRS